MDDLDSPWKEFLDEYLPEFCLLCFPDIYRRIDWSKNYESLESELQQIAPDNEVGRRHVDKLYRVYSIDGTVEWVLIHVEVQNQRDGEFPLRMYQYQCRIYEKFSRRAVSIAVFGDDDPKWRPDRYVDDLWGCRVDLQFPIFKLLDFKEHIEELEQSSNPAALVVLAHLNAVATRRNSEQRLALKSHLVRLLYDRGWDRERVFKLLRFIVG